MDDEPSTTIDIRQYAALLLRWLWLIALATLLGAMAAYVVSKRTTPVYAATATLLITPGDAVYGDSYNAIYASQQLAQTYAQMLTGRPVLEGAEARLGRPLDAAGISATLVRDTQLIQLSVQHTQPEMAAAIANAIPEVFAQINEESQLARYRASQESLLGEMQRVQADMDAAQRALEAERARPAPDTAEVGRLETLLAQYRSTYAGLLQSYEDVRVAEARGTNTVTLYERALVPGGPVLPRTRNNVMLAAVVGAMLAVGAAFLVEFLDDTVKTPADVQRLVRLPTFATIVRFAEEAEGAGPVMASHPSSLVGEAYRVLRTNLQFATLGMGHSAVAVLVTSAGPQEGKSTTVVNLAVSLAQAGKRVLLVDTDLRRPTLHKQFGLANDTGVTTLYLSDTPLERAVRDTEVAGLQVLTSGPIPANPAEVLAFPQTEQLLQQLRTMADYVLLDSPPVLSVADASILAQKADGVLLVAEMGHTRAGAFKNVAAALQGVQAKLLGVVLNKVHEGRSGYNYYYHYYYGGDGKKVRGRRQATPPPLRSGLAPALRSGLGMARRGGQAAVVADLPGAPDLSVQAGRAFMAERRQRERGRRIVKYGAYAAGGLAVVLAVGMGAMQLFGGGLLRGGAAPEPTAAVEPTASLPTAAPTAEATVAATTVPTAQPVAIYTAVPTRAPATAVPAPATKAPATVTARPAATATLAPTAAPIAGPHGTSGRLRLRDGRSEYAVNEPVYFALELENTGDAPVSLGIVGLKADRDVPFKWSWTEVTVQPHSVFTAEDQIAFPAAGAYSVKMGVCFSATGACSGGSGEWAEYEPAVAVSIR